MRNSSFRGPLKRTTRNGAKPSHADIASPTHAPCASQRHTRSLRPRGFRVTDVRTVFTNVAFHNHKGPSCRKNLKKVSIAATS
jgi:hypothetical protein